MASEAKSTDKTPAAASAKDETARRTANRADRRARAALDALAPLAALVREWLPTMPSRMKDEAQAFLDAHDAARNG